MSPLIRQERLTRIESSLTPKQAALLMVRKTYQGRTSDELEQWLIQRPVSAYPRPVLAHQMEDAIRSAMKRQDAGRVNGAVRQAQMHADFLILLVNQLNWEILDDSRCRRLQTLLLYERLRNAALAGDEEKALNEWVRCLRGVAIELFSLEAASTLIQEKYFDGECILLKDAIEDLELQTKLVKNMMDAYDRVAVEAGKPERATDLDKLSKEIQERASGKAEFIVALAKSKMLDDFGEHEAAGAVVKPYFLAERLTGEKA